MGQPFSEDDIERIARKRAGAKMGWFIHAAVYVLVNALIFAMSHHAFGTRPWSVFPLLGWGLGLAMHGLAVFVLGSGSGLREHLVAKERERLLRERDRAGRP
jgi:hypothetical protein